MCKGESETCFDVAQLDAAEDRVNFSFLPPQSPSLIIKIMLMLKMMGLMLTIEVGKGELEEYQKIHILVQFENWWSLFERAAPAVSLQS